MTRCIVKPNRIESEMDQLFNNFFRTPVRVVSENRSNDFVPAVDIFETEDHLKLDFEIPGMKKEDIKIVLKDGRLTVRGEKKFTAEEKSENLVRSEIRTGSFERSFKLPQSINQDDIEASYRCGILEVKLLKKEEAKPKEIEVKIA